MTLQVPRKSWITEAGLGGFPSPEAVDGRSTRFLDPNDRQRHKQGRRAVVGRCLVGSGTNRRLTVHRQHPRVYKGRDHREPDMSLARFDSLRITLETPDEENVRQMGNYRGV